MHSDKLLVKCEEEPGSHPHCPHGSMLYFYKQCSPSSGYFACSAFRDKKSCNHRINVQDLTQPLKEKRYPVETYGYKKLRRKIKSVSEDYRYFCHSCHRPFIYPEQDLHSNHNTVQVISDEMFSNPTCFIKPLDNNKEEAQYFFDENSIKFFTNCLYRSKSNKVISVGAPRLHAYLKAHTHIKSFLLDFDHRYFYFYDDSEFAWYNMCNNHFFDENQCNAFKQFISMGADENLAIFTDPPFGCRTEVVTNSIKQIINLSRSLSKQHKIPAVFWVYPYFCEFYIREAMPEMEMCDYKINYTNHESYSNGTKGRKLGSPVRLFTNVPLTMLVLPPKGYKFCVHCNFWTAKENVHCRICGLCPAKNGDTYRHCVYCRICVKPNYVHCVNCRRCTQKENHNCVKYQRVIRCWICLKTGHNELNCRAIKVPTILSPNICLICRRTANHNEKRCPNRKKHDLTLLEYNFIQKTE